MMINLGYELGGEDIHFSALWQDGAASRGHVDHNGYTPEHSLSATKWKHCSPTPLSSNA